MGAGAGGYVQITLHTLESKYDPDTEQLHRVSELSFIGAPFMTRLLTVCPEDTIG